MKSSEHPPAIGHIQIGFQQHDLAVGIGDAQHQNFGHELADLAGREIDDADDPTTGQGFRILMFGDLC